METERVTEKVVAINVLKQALALWDAGPAMDAEPLAAYVAGYEVGLQDLIDWLAEEYTITQAELDAWPVP
jgi:hypothetical protein